MKGLSQAHLEAVACSQGQVIGVGSEGAIWCWGLPLDGLETQTGDPKREDLAPRIVALGSQRVRRIVSGRKHYVAVIAAAFAPNCFIERIGCALEEEVGGVVGKVKARRNIEAQQQIVFSAGDVLEVRVITVDERGEVIRAGGDAVGAFLTRLATHALPDDKAPAIPHLVLESRDQGNGMHIGKCHLKVAAEFDLTVSVTNV